MILLGGDWEFWIVLVFLRFPIDVFSFHRSKIKFWTYSFWLCKFCSVWIYTKKCPKKTQSSRLSFFFKQIHKYVTIINFNQNIENRYFFGSKITLKIDAKYKVREKIVFRISKRNQKKSKRNQDKNQYCVSLWNDKILEY